MAQELIQSGQTYKITNAKSGTVIDLSGTDHRSIIGFPSHGGPNQQWTMNWTNIGWTFQCQLTKQYIGLDGSPADGTRLVAVSAPVGWDIWHDQVNPGTYRIFVHGTHFNWDLYGDGNPAPGTPITLWYAWSGIHQTWQFELV